jgi:hypothetical protein
MQPPVSEIINWNGQPLVYIIRPDPLPERTTFVTPPEFKQQVGFVVYPRGSEIARHIHLALQRQLVGTSEVLVLLKGRCLDVMLMVAGGHGFRMQEDTVFLEIKQGPYLDTEEKERF